MCIFDAGVTSHIARSNENKEKTEESQKQETNHKNEDDDQFSMDI